MKTADVETPNTFGCNLLKVAQGSEAEVTGSSTWHLVRPIYCHLLYKTLQGRLYLESKCTLYLCVHDYLCVCVCCEVRYDCNHRAKKRFSESPLLLDEKPVASASLP